MKYLIETITRDAENGYTQTTETDTREFESDEAAIKYVNEWTDLESFVRDGLIDSNIENVEDVRGDGYYITIKRYNDEYGDWGDEIFRTKTVWEDTIAKELLG